MPASLGPLIALCAIVAAAVLAFVVLVGHPVNDVDLLAWAAVALAAGLLALIVPARVR
jgi:hypothetical protein